jgi:hypothetical protein
MLRKLRNRNAQSIMSEYVLLFFIVFAAVGAMSVYFKRAIQARMLGARNTMGDVIRARAGGTEPSVIRKFYEPYYLESSADVSRDEEVKTGHFQGGGTRVEVNMSTGISSNSVTAPPWQAK